MRKSILTYMLLMIIVLLIILSGCKKKESITQEPVKEPSESGEDIVEEEIDIEGIMKDFNNIVESKNEPDKIVGFMDEQIGKLTDVEGEEMVSKLEKILEEYLEFVTNNILNLDTEGELISIGGNELFFPEDRVQAIENNKLREEVIKTLDSKYKLINLEGNYYPIIDYEKLKDYNEYISPELKEYIAIRAMDSNEPIAIDGALYISYDQLGKRILAIEDYIQRYAGGKRYEEMLKSYRSKLKIYLSGIDNSPIADEETGKIYDDVLASYKAVGNTKDQVTGFIIRKYIEIIEENDYIIDEKVKGNVLSLINESLSLLEQSK